MILRDYQKQIATQASQILREKGLVLLLMQVRTGKTATALHCCHLFGSKKVLFVTKKAIISSIEADYSGVSFSYLHAYHFTVTNYEQLGKFKNDYDTVVVDEFHSFGAYPVPSERTKALRNVCKGAHVIMLSGTPTPESYSQFYNALSVSERSPWASYKNFYSWAKHYVTVRLKYIYNRQINDYSQANYEKIEKDIAPYVIRFTQEEAGFETVVEDRIIFIDTPVTVMTAIKLLTRDKIIKTESGDVVLGDTAVKLMMKIHQISSGAVKTEEGNYIAFNDFKAVAIRDKFEGKKIAIFYKYIAERIHLEKVFNGRIVETPEEFNSTGPARVFISQIQSGREGINLSAADFLVMYNIDFSALSYWQARERMNVKERIKDSVVIWMMSTGGIEHKIYEVVQKKLSYTLRHFNKDYGTRNLERHTGIKK